jgi:hypothetical protein
MLSGDDHRAAFFRHRDRPYLALAQLEMAAGRHREAFSILERGRARALLDLMASLRSGRRGRRPAAGLEKQAEDLLATLSQGYQNEARNLDGGHRYAPAPALWVSKIQALEVHATRILNRLNRSRSVGVFLPQVDERWIRAHLKPFETLVVYFELAGQVGAFRLTRESFQTLESLTPANETAEIAEGLRFQWGRFRLDGGVLDRHSPQIFRLTQADLIELHRRLIDPLGLEPGHRLIVVPTSALRAIPFAALHDGRRHLVQGRSVSVCPSASVFQSCRTRSESKGGPVLLMGVADRRAPEVAREVQDLKGIFPAAKDFLGSGATVACFRREAARAAVIHIATHGLFHTERPNLSGVRLWDRWLYGYDVTRQNLTARLVTLSACATGQSAAWSGGEWMGLARSFLSAGAKRVLVGLWEVDDAATRNLMRGFYQGLSQGLSVSDALAKTQSQLAALGHHPYYWSGFSLMGDL